MTPRKPVKHHTPIAASYLAELRARVEDGPGIAAVARAAGLHRNSVWRAISGEKGRRPTFEAIEGIRRALAKLEPDREAPSAPVVAVRGAVHAKWIAIGDAMTPAELERAIKTPAGAVRAARASRRAK